MYVFIYVWDKPEEKLREKIREVLFDPLFVTFFDLPQSNKIPYLLLLMWNFEEINYDKCGWKAEKETF